MGWLRRNRDDDPFRVLREQHGYDATEGDADGTWAPSEPTPLGEDATTPYAEVPVFEDTAAPPPSTPPAEALDADTTDDPRRRSGTARGVAVAVIVLGLLLAVAWNSGWRTQVERTTDTLFATEQARPRSERVKPRAPGSSLLEPEGFNRAWRLLVWARRGGLDDTWGRLDVYPGWMLAQLTNARGRDVEVTIRRDGTIVTERGGVSHGLLGTPGLRDLDPQAPWRMLAGVRRRVGERARPNWLIFTDWKIDLDLRLTWVMYLSGVPERVSGWTADEHGGRVRRIR